MYALVGLHYCIRKYSALFPISINRRAIRDTLWGVDIVRYNLKNKGYGEIKRKMVRGLTNCVLY